MDDPHGAYRDTVRSCYRSWMRVSDHDSPIRVRWYFIPRPPPGPLDPGPYTSSNWDQDDSDPSPPLGELSAVRAYRGGWVNGRPPPWCPCWASKLVAEIDSARTLGRVMPAAVQAVASVDQLRTLSLGVSGGGACVTSVDATRTLGLVASGTGLGVAAISGTITTASTNHAGTGSAVGTVAGLSGTTNTGASGRLAARARVAGLHLDDPPLHHAILTARASVVGRHPDDPSFTKGNLVGPVQVNGASEHKVVPPISGQTKTPGKVTITVIGATNGTCPDCANANGTWTLSYAGLSVWALAGPVVCGSGTVLHFGNGGGGNTWTFTGLPGATYQTTLGGTWDGVSNITLSLVGAPTQCGYPLTVTVHPVY